MITATMIMIPASQIGRIELINKKLNCTEFLFEKIGIF